MHHLNIMPNRVPRTYDEITRATVPDPDSSWRPSDLQEKEAYEGFRALDADEQALHDRVDDALLASGEDLSQLAFEVDRDRVILRGQVRTATALRRVLEIVEHVRGVRGVVDHLVIAGH
jgi:hypothetical protein